MVSYQILMKKIAKKCFGLKKSLYLCTRKNRNEMLNWAMV